MQEVVAALPQALVASCMFLLWMSIPKGDDDEPPTTGTAPVTH